MSRIFRPLPPAAHSPQTPNAPFRYLLAGLVLGVIGLSTSALSSFQGGVTTPADTTDQQTRAATKRLSGPVSKVHSADSFEVAGVAVHFSDLDCPEPGTQSGDQATQALRREITGKDVRCDLADQTSRDHYLGVCTTASGLTIRNLMLRAGHCATQ